MKNLKLLFLLAFAFLAACSDDDNEITPTATCTDGIQNGDETGIDCGGSCTACEEVSCEDFTVSFEENGQYGPNLLRSTDSNIDTLQITPFSEVSMEATTSANCTSLKIVVTNLTATDCEFGCWAYLPSLNQNWDISEYTSPTDPQTYTATEMDMDLPLSNFVKGVYELQYYVNDSLTHTNYIQSTEDELDPFIEGVDVWSFTSDGDDLYVVSDDFVNTFYGIIDINNPSNGITNQFLGTGVEDITWAMAAKNGELYYYDFDANAIRKLNLTVDNPSPVTVITDVEYVIDMAFDGDVLYMTVSNGDLIDVGRADLATDNPSITVISEGNATFTTIDISNKTLYISDFYEGLATIDLTNESYPVVMNESYFSDEFLSVTSIKASNTHIYYASSGIIGRVDLVSNEREILVQTNRIDFFSDIHIEEGFFIFTNPNEQTIYKQDF